MSDRFVNSAALYFGFDAPKAVPVLWLTSAISFFWSQGISLDYFDITAEGYFSPDETFEFARHERRVFEAVRKGVVENVGLYCNPNPDEPKSEWRAAALLEMENGMLFLGVDAVRFPQHAFLLRSAYALAGECLRVRYGISYLCSLAQGPDSYAAGVPHASLSEIGSELSSPDESDRRFTAWRHEKYGARRYLCGLFRGAYPASIISHAHMVALQNRAGRRQIPGRITPFVEKELWLWELTSSEMAAGERLLEETRLLVG